MRGLLVITLAWLAAAAQRPAPTADHHQHLFSPEVAERAPGREVVDANRLIALLDEAGIRRAVVLSLAYQCGNPNRPPIEDERECVRRENNWTSIEVARHADRLVAFCSVNPLRPYATEEIMRCGADRRLRRGLKLHFGNSDVDLTRPGDAARLREVFALANRQGMAIIVHARTTISLKRPYDARHARVFLDMLLPAAPDVPVQIAHLAGAGGFGEPGVEDALAVFADAIASKDPRVARLWFDVSGVAGFGDWAAHAPRVAERIRQLGVERVLWGADGSTGDHAPAAAWQAFAATPLTPQELDTIRTNVAPYLR